MMGNAFGSIIGRVPVPPPGPRSTRLAKELALVESPAVSTMKSGVVPIFWDEALGANVKDVDGNTYVDLTSGFCVASVGHRNPRVVDAITRQTKRLLHTQGAANPCESRVRLAQKLAQIAVGDCNTSHIANTGSEVVDAAYKAARLYTGRPGFISFHGGFHGKLGASVTLTARDYYRKYILPMVPEVHHLPYAYCYRCPFERTYPACDLFCARFVDYCLSNKDSGLPDVAGLILEPVQGHRGWVVPPPDFLKQLRRTCDNHGIALICDEIITGFGRTGKWFACQHSDVVPDIMTVGKSMGDGFPIAAYIARRKVVDKYGPFQHSSTFVGHPVGCAAALAVIEYIEEENLVERSAEMGAYFKEALIDLQARHPSMGDVRGLGMMVGIEVVRNRDTKEPGPEEAARMLAEMNKRGVFANNLGGTYYNVFKLTPPLVITKEQIDFAVQVIDEAFTVVEKHMDF